MQTVKRYVVTHMGKYGRTLAMPQQGRYTYDTPEAAQHWIDEVLAQNTAEHLVGLFGMPLEVRECECYDGHLDPVGIYFD